MKAYLQERYEELKEILEYLDVGWYNPNVGGQMKDSPWVGETQFQNDGDEVDSRDLVHGLYPL
jgi:hypothetical protein